MNSTPVNLGNLTRFDRTADGLLAYTTHGIARISFWLPSVVRVTVSRETLPDHFSYAVCSKPQPVTTELEEHHDRLVLFTASLTVVINRSPFALTFIDPKGRTLSQDDPGLTVSWIGEQVTNYKTMQEGERFVGLGEKTGPLDRRGHGYQNWNVDAYSYNSGTDPLYCSMPFFMGIHHDVVYGLFLDNSHKSHFNFGASNNRFSSISADAGLLDYYFFAGDEVSDLIQQYTWLTGRTPIPPRWSLGYQQCRYSYYPDKEVLSVARNFRDKHIPADVIVLDIHYMDHYKIFTWDPTNFSHPEQLIQQLRDMGFEVVVLCDPGIKEEPGYHAYDDGMKENIFLTYPDGKPYTGMVWPGWCHFPDFTNEKTRSWWRKHLASYTKLGIRGIWNDMNEIATWGHMLPDNIVFHFEGNTTTSRQGRNVYGFQMARSSYEAGRALLGGERPFNLTRSGFSGVQRYSAVWTGDNVSYDEHMMLGVRLVNSMGLTGVAFAGYDVGGFVGEASTKLFARWISLAAFSPFFRGHTMINTRDSEPWAFGEEVEQIARNYIRFRYQMMPYLYSLFADAYETGLPVQRSLAIQYPHDHRVFNGTFQHQYLFGPYFLVAPVESHKEFVKVFFPEGSWYSLFDGVRYEGNSEVIVEAPIHRLPVFVKGGAVIPMQPPVEYTQQSYDELILHVYAEETSNSFVWYDDDGRTFAYETGVWSKRLLTHHAHERKLDIGATEGTYRSGLRSLRLVLHGYPSINQVQANGESLSVQTGKMSYFIPMQKYDPINDPDRMGDETVQWCSLPYSNEAIHLIW